MLAVVGGLDDVVDGREPAGHVGRTGDGEQLRTRRKVERLDHVIQREGAVAAALDEPATAQPGPRQQVGVVLDHRRDDGVVR